MIPTSAIVSGAVTGGLLVAAFVTGGLYLDKRNDYDTTKSEDDRDSAKTLGIANAVLFAGAAAGAGLTTYFYVTRPEEPRQVAAARPRAVPSGITAGFVVRH